MTAPRPPSALRALGRQLLFYGPAALASLAYATSRAGWPVLAWPPAGLLAWTLGYYLVHRFLLHGPAWRWARWLDNHRYHHQEPSDPTEIVFGIPETLPLFTAAAALFLALTRSLPATAAALAGFAAGYLTYETLHAAVHSPRLSKRPWVQRWGENHLRHHNDARHNFGTITTLWDRVFGTLRR